MSFHAFHGHSGSGMTRNEIETEWQGWGRNDDFSHSEHIPFIPVIPDVWEKCCLSWFHPYHSSLIPSFWCHSKIPFQLEWCWNDEWFWAEVDYFPLCVKISSEQQLTYCNFFSCSYSRARWIFENQYHDPPHMFFNVKFNFKASLFSSTFWFERSFRSGNAILVFGPC